MKTQTIRKARSVYLSDEELKMIKTEARKCAMPYSRFIAQMLVEAIRAGVAKKFYL